MSVCGLYTVHMRVHADEALSQANVAVDRLYIQHYRFKLRGLIIHTEVLLNEEYVLCHTHTQHKHFIPYNPGYFKGEAQ